MSNDDRLLGKLEQGIDNLATGQATIMADLTAHRKETAELHRAAAKRISATEGDLERVEAKVDGHADEDNKRFSNNRWIISGLSTMIVGLVTAWAAFAR